MATAAELKTAYRAVVRSDLGDDDASAIVASGISLDSYISTLISQTTSTTSAGFALTAFITGLGPTAQQLTTLKVEAELQVESYAKLGVANPALGPFEAFGRSLAVDDATKATFVAKYGALSTTDFVNLIYSEVYCAKITDGAFANLSAQVSYFTDMLSKANVADATLAAKGAALGQLIGYAFLDADAGKTAVIDDQVRAVLTAAAKGDETVYHKELPFIAKPCDLNGPNPTTLSPDNPDPPNPPDPPKDVTPPAFASGAQATMVENTPAATIAYQAVATDPSAPVTFALSGVDKNLFSIEAATGAVRFLASPDFENPQDDGKNNIYDINVVATDNAGNAATKAVAITVTDAPEAPSIWRASVDSGGAQGVGLSSASAISANGRYVTFSSTASNLVADDKNAKSDIFVYDNTTKTTTRVSIDGGGAEGSGDSVQSAISGDGRYITFRSVAANLVAGDANNKSDTFVHDTVTHSTTRISLGAGGAEGNGDSTGRPSISDDGRYVAFESRAANLVAGDLAGRDDLFLHDLQTNQTIRISGIGVDGNEANLGSYSPAVSANGNIIAFQSLASNLVIGDANGGSDFFIFDKQAGATTRVSLDSLGNQTSGHSLWLALSADGRYVTFQSNATNLVPNDTNGVRDIFRHDRTTSETVRVSVDSSGNEGNGGSFFNAISANGRYVAFQSDAANLVANDTNKSYDIFVRDMALNKTYRVSVDNNGQQAFGSNPAALGNADSTDPSISDDGRFITFTSVATNLVPDDTNATRDVFVVDGQAQGWWFA